jgi:hypothetical protein
MKTVLRYAHIKTLAHNIAAIKTNTSTNIILIHVLQIHKRINGTTCQILKLQNGSTAIFHQQF